MLKPVAVVAGAGPGNGAALAHRFAEAGYAVALLARHRAATDLSDARSYECDVSIPVSVERAFFQIRAELGEVDVLLYNAGSGVFADIVSITPDQFERAWRGGAGLGAGRLLVFQGRQNSPGGEPIGKWRRARKSDFGIVTSRSDDLTIPIMRQDTLIRTCRNAKKN